MTQLQGRSVLKPEYIRLYEQLVAGVTPRPVERISPEVALQPSAGGLHLVARLPEGFDDVATARAAGQRGMHAWALSAHTIAHQQAPALLLGYGGVRPVHRRGAVHVLAQAARDPEG